MAHRQQLPENLPLFAREVLELFARQLPDLKFPGIDLAVLEAHAAQLAEAQGEVERVEAELEQARAEAAVRALTLTTVAQRALAYARIYAEGDAELEAQVAEITERRGGGGTEPAPVRRRRARRSEADASLFAGVDPESSAEASALV
jgi:hypothetical protein